MNFDFTLLWQQLTSAAYLNGALLAIGVAIVALVLSLLIGYAVALGGASKHGVVRGVSAAYVWIFRAIPALLVLLVVWNALPQLLPIFREDWFTPFWAAAIGLAVVEAAYSAEVIRSALMSVDEGQVQAARALGMTPVQTQGRIVLPQALRIALPPLGNSFIGLIKFTSLASVISLRELMATAQVGVATTFRYAEFYTAAAIYYIVIVSILSIVQRRIEKRFEWTSTAKRSTITFRRVGASA
jgi:amine acid ABC transporter, permease protein, 3-TM region, His/Glu/Gln/Arg/opine family